MERVGKPRDYSNGSSLTIDAAWLLPTQKVTGVVELSTNTRRTFVNLGRRYSTISPVSGLRRSTRSLNSPAAQAWPFLSAVTSYGQDSALGASHSWKCSVFVSNIPILLAVFSPNQRRPCESIIPRRGAEAAVGVGYVVIFLVLPSICPMSALPKTVK